MTLRGLVLALLVCACMGVPASANATESYPGERVLNDQRIQTVMQTAQSYWEARGVTACPAGITVLVADDLRSAWEGDVAIGLTIGRGSDCRVWLLAGAVKSWRRVTRPSGMVLAAWDECMVVTHEVGHALGLFHEPSGVMQAQALDAALIDECERYGYRFGPRTRIKGSHAKNKVAVNRASRAGRLR